MPILNDPDRPMAVKFSILEDRLKSVGLNDEEFKRLWDEPVVERLAKEILRLRKETGQEIKRGA